MKLKVSRQSESNAGQTPARCPQCGREGTFDVIGKDLMIGDNIFCGQRRCPNPSCYGHLFVIIQNGDLQKAYPPIRLDIDSENIPSTVLSTFEEALDCHANGSYTASAIMVRRTLEEICEERKAKGKNLKEKIQDLSRKIILPVELIEAMDELRLLGNDAAHIHAKDYSSISEPELNVAIQFTKEILKAIYQYSALLEKMRALKNQGT